MIYCVGYWIFAFWKSRLGRMFLDELPGCYFRNDGYRIRFRFLRCSHFPWIFPFWLLLYAHGGIFFIMLRFFYFLLMKLFVLMDFRRITAF